MPFVELVRALQVPAVKQERVLTIEQAGSQRLAIPVADQRTDGRGYTTHNAQGGNVNAHLVLRSQESGGEQQAIARQKEPDEQTALGEDDRGDDDVASGDDRLWVERSK